MSQVNFFMLASDETEFLRMIRSRNDTFIYSRQCFDNPNPQPLEFLPSFGHQQSFTLLLPAIAPPLEISNGQYQFRTYSHPIIEYSRSYFDKDTLVSGRIYAKIGWLKPAENNRLYKSWYASLERWLKKRYFRVQQEWWVAPEAKTWSMKGGLLALGSPSAMKISLSG